MAHLLLLHLLAAALAPWLAKVLRTKAFPVLALAPAVSFGWLVSVSGDVRAGHLPTQSISWVPGLGIDLDFRLTTLSWVLALLVTGVGALVLLYCTWYFADRDPTLWRFASVFTAFAGAMLGLVLTDNLLVLYVFWELTTVFSYLLIGHNPASSTNRRAAMQALIVTTFGGLAMLVGIITFGVHRTYSISELLADPPPLDALTVAALVLLLVGALSKSALVPFHFWLPGAMAAPTPVSAYSMPRPWSRQGSTSSRCSLRPSPALLPGTPSPSALASSRCSSAAGEPCGRTTSSSSWPTAP